MQNYAKVCKQMQKYATTIFKSIQNYAEMQTSSAQILPLKC